MRTARAIIAGLVVASSMGLAGKCSAQSIQNLVPFNATWRYSQPTADIGTAWRAPGFNDSSWPSGQGLLQGGEGTAYPVPFLTTITAPNDGTGRITDYFRTTFNFSGTTNGVFLYSTNFVDDGCVIYLNGLEAGRFRVPAGQNYLTPGAGPAAEGQVDFLAISPGLLRQGLNTLAVEVHQSGATSSDVVWGTRLVISQPSPLAITQQPENQTASAGETVTFSVSVSGGPVFYQWQKNQVNIQNATNRTYSISPVGIPSVGTYRVIVTNSISRLTSSNAVLIVFADTLGPSMTSAVVLDTGATNQIDILFDDTVESASATTNNIRVVRSGTSGANSVYVAVTNIIAPGTRTVRLRVSGDNWNVRSNYYVLVNNVTDRRGNSAAANSVFPLSFRVRTNVTQMSDYWDYYAQHDLNQIFYPATADQIYTDNQWYLPNYVPSNGVEQMWGRTYGILYKDVNETAELCAGDGLNKEQEINFQNFPTLFRSTFNLGTNFGTVGPISGTLQLRYMVDDGMVLYLNGTEIYRYNMAAGSVGPNSQAIVAIDNPTCSTNIEINVTNLLPRMNTLAAAVVNVNSSSTDVYFGLELDGVFLRPGAVPTNGPASQLKLTSALVAGTPKRLRVTWPNSGQNIYYGYFLEESSELLSAAGATQWLTVSNQSNGVALPMMDAHRFYQLRKGPNSGR